MRERNEANGISVHAISGSHVVTLGFDATNQARQGLLGFGIRRDDHAGERAQQQYSQTAGGVLLLAAVA